MMKRFINIVATVATLLFAASCAKENLDPVAETAVVTYTIEVPGAATTKALGDEVTEVNQLIYEVYRIDADGKITDDVLCHEIDEISGGVAKVSIEFVQGQDYKVLFWAQNKDLSVYNTADLRSVQLSSPGESNNRAAQVFAGNDVIKDGKSSSKGAVKLTRPISQLNIATTLESLVPFGDANKVELKESSVKVVGKLSKSFSVETLTAGTVEDVEHTYISDVVIAEKLNVDGKDYQYVAMNYVGFAPNDGATVAVTYTIKKNEGADITNTVPNVPLKPNFRTNIIGNLITSSQDYKVELDENWGGTYVGPEFVQVPAYDQATKTWTVTNASELAWVAASVNGTIGVQTKAGATTKNFKGETVLLANDIDLEGKLWTPIGTVLGQSRYDYLFAGTFDGNGKTIYNLKVNHADCAGLFGNMCTAIVKDLTINGFDLKADHYAGAIVGWVEQGASEVLIENCKAINGNIQINVVEIEGGKHDLGDKAGAIVGFSHHGKYIDNEVENVIIEGYRDLGGIVGYGNNSVVTGNSIVDVTLVQNLTIDYKKDEEENGSTPTTVKDYVGREGGTCTIVDNTGEANIVKAIASGVYASKTEIDAEGNEVVTEYSIYASEGLEWLAESVTVDNSFDGVTVKLTNDIELPEDKNWEPIGDNRTEAAFKGTFDGENHTIKGAKITGSHFGMEVYMEAKKDGVCFQLWMRPKSKI